ncbi:MAG: glucose-6-phosphate isomerase, partial [Betaproteobacteria bacterium AqS2]|nr:glucose-6-phosphate isomerase [Betaproteobacteria bacterium AqS2]
MSHETFEKLRTLAAQVRARPQAGGELRICEAAGIELDYSKSFLTAEAAALLEKLAKDTALAGQFKAMAAGEKINTTEGRAVEHVKLRPSSPETAAMLPFAEQLRAGEIKGCTGESLNHVLHIGIGGSYLGPRLLYEALGDGKISCDFVANADPAAIDQALAACDPARTLIVAVSKSGTTPETIQNAQVALEHFRTALGQEPAGHLAYVSTKEEAMKGALGEGRYLAMDESIGGRYSVWSAVSLAAAAACGAKRFEEFLAGAHEMDEHVLAASGWENIAVAKALVHLWQQLVWEAQTHCVVVYANRLRSLPAYLQQLVMESNGKSVTKAGEPVPLPSSPIWWGGEGTNEQHSYFQLLLQGSHRIPLDFVYARQPEDPAQLARHRELVAHCLGQSNAMHYGFDLDACKAALKENEPAELAPHKVVPGLQPVNLLACERLDARRLGALIALYEHAVAALGWIWGINSFDQWGVEFGKSNYKKVLAA